MVKKLGVIAIMAILVLLTGACKDPASASDPTVWTLTWHLDGGSWPSGPPLTQIEDGQVLTKPPDPNKPGNNFGGWYSDNGLSNEYSFTSTVTANLNLYAKWIQHYSEREISINFYGFDDEEIDLRGSETIRFRDTLTVTVHGTYDSYQWLLNGMVMPEWTGNSIEYRIPPNFALLGENKITVFVVKDGVSNSKELTFRVEN